MNANYRAYIKDCLNLTGLPKCFVTVREGDISGDILTRASSSFNILEEVPDIIKEGDVFCLYKYNGEVIYNGVITSTEEKRIRTDQIWSLFNVDWFYRTDKQDYLEHEIAVIFQNFMEGRIGQIVTSIPASNQDNFAKNMNYYILNGSNYDEYRVNKTQYDGIYTVVSSLPTASENTMNDTIYLVGSTAPRSAYMTIKTTNNNVTTYSWQLLGTTDAKAGDETAYIYSTDKIGQLAVSEIDTITDPLLIQKYSAFDVTYEGSQTSKLISVNDIRSTRNMEEFIYKLYANYGIVIDITIPYQGRCEFHIKSANYNGTKISRNTSTIISITPTTETEELNKLIIMGTLGNYRKTYYATPNGIVEDGSSTDRLPEVNNRIIFSDDSLSDIKADYLASQMYNHQIVFEMSLDNQIYDFDSWRFGQPLEVYYRGFYYQSVYTGYSYSFAEGEKLSKVTITCGKVRTKLTDLINMKKA